MLVSLLPISDNERTSSAIEAAGTTGLSLVTFAGTPIRSVLFQNSLTSIVQLSFDAGTNLIDLLAGYHPVLEFADKGGRLLKSIKVRKKGSTTVTGGSIVAWATVG